MDGLKLINPELDIEFAGKAYKIRKANLEKVIQFQDRMTKLTESKDSAWDLKGAAYCIYLVLVDVDKSITEEWVLTNAPGDLDTYQIFESLGFMSRQKVELMRALTQRNAPAQTETKQTGE